MLTVQSAHSERWNRIWVALLAVTAFAVPVSAEKVAPSLVDTALERGEYAEAARLRWQEARQSRDPGKFEVAARLAYDWSQYSVVVTVCEDWLRQDAKSETAHRLIAVSAIELDRRDLARTHLEWLLQSAYPSLNEGFDSLGRSLSELRNRAGVAAVMRDLSQRHPQIAEGHFQAGSLALAAGNSRWAIEGAQRALALGKRKQGRSLEARARVVQGDCEQGLALAAPLGSEVRDLDRLTEAWLLTLCNRGAEAESILQEVAQRQDQRAAALEALAGRELETHRREAAGRHYNELFKAGDPSSAQFGLAALAERAGNPERALAMYSAITSGRHVVEAQLRAYRLRAASEGPEFADWVLDEFVYSNPDLRLELTVGRMLAMANMGRAGAAVALGGRLAQAYPDAEDVMRAQAEVLVRAGKVDDALVLLERLLSRRPNDPAVQNALGYTLVDSGRNLRRAGGLLEAAIAQSPDNPAYLDSLGWLRFKRQSWSDAVALLTRAYRLQSDAEIARHLTESLYASGAQEEAGRFLLAALDAHPGDKHLLDLQRLHLQRAP